MLKGTETCIPDCGFHMVGPYRSREYCVEFVKLCEIKKKDAVLLLMKPASLYKKKLGRASEIRKLDGI